MTQRNEQEPQVEDEALVAEWEHMARIRAEARREVPAMPYDCEKLWWDPLESTCRHASLSIL